MMTRMSSMQCSQRTLSHLSLVFGLVACGALSLAVSTDFWLHTSENLDPALFINAQMGLYVLNDTRFGGGSPLGVPGIPGDPEILGPAAAKQHSGLWRSCTSYDESEYGDDAFPSCTNIVYFGQDNDRPEKADTTTSILRGIRKSAPVIVSSLLVMLTALALSILGNNKRDVRTLLAAILYICAALSLAIGVIFYISAVNDEVSHRKKSMTAESEGFTYHYGWAFFFAGSSFMCSMVASVNNISLYLRRYPKPDEQTPPTAAPTPELLLSNNRNITTPV